MKLSPSNTNNLQWTDSVLFLGNKNKPSKSLLKIHEGGIDSIYDLLWITPLRIQNLPKLEPFNQIEIDKLFYGEAKVIQVRHAPAYGRRGKGRVQLFNTTVLVQDLHSSETLVLKWFNAYPNLKKQLEALEKFRFLGSVTEYQGQFQIINPKLNPNLDTSGKGMLIEYPTFNTIAGKNIEKIIDKIPEKLWNQPLPSLSSLFENELKINTIENSLKALHGKSGECSPKDAINRMIYEEFFTNQLKVLARKLKNKSLRATAYKIEDQRLKEYKLLFPYELTKDQNSVLDTIREDFSSSNPMMRLIQGDVGCGKTTVAILSAIIMAENKKQSALMCPTETLALQHFKNFKSIIGDKFTVEILLGSTKPKEKKIIYKKLIDGEIDILIGTHSLFQDTVEFNNLQLAIIDEQHKFGVNQRQALRDKGENVHTLIMTATPIPRSLQLAQYGDLDISTIRTMPMGRKGIKTRIVTDSTYDKYLSFVKTRLEMGEQAYIVVPAIEESHTELKNIEELLITYQKYFPEYNVKAIHGQVKNDEKQMIMDDFSQNKINILISTTVIEVGIDVKNATVISIYNPERFGLSSLHQLRGRVGRGEKTGFCFLITESKTPKDSLERIKVIEKSTDGFEIAEADLKIRGQGDLFGSSQSGHLSDYKFGNIFLNFDIFEKVSQDIEKLKVNQTEKLNNVLLELSSDKNVSSTI